MVTGSKHACTPGLRARSDSWACRCMVAAKVSRQKGRVRAAAVAKDWTGWKETRRAVGSLVRGNGDGTGPYVAM